MKSQSFIESRDEMETLLREEVLGYLGVSLDREPYVVPLNYAYLDGKILFHCGHEGKKLAYLKANPTVCFTVARQHGSARQHAEGNPCHLDSYSVICNGTARVIEQPEERKAAINTFADYFLPDDVEIPPERAMKCTVVEITISKMTGRRERDRKVTRWQHTFET